MRSRMIMTSVQSLTEARLRFPNSRHLLNAIGVQRLAMNKGDIMELQARIEKSRDRGGFYHEAFMAGYNAVKPVVQKWSHEEHPVLREIAVAEKLHPYMMGFGSVSTHTIGGLTVKVSPSVNSMNRFAVLNRCAAEEIAQTVELIGKDRLGEARIELAEDSPLSDTEYPSITQFRGDVGADLTSGINSWILLKEEMKRKYPGFDRDGIKNVVVFGIGANDMYLRALAEAVNNDPERKADLHVAFGPEQFLKLPHSMNSENTLVIAISRSGTTQDTLKTMEFNARDGKFQHVITLANKGPIKELADREGYVTHPLREDIGGRYMREKGLIVLLPLLISGSQRFLTRYFDAMQEFDSEYFPVGEKTDVIDMASHMHFFISTFNMPQIVAMSNNPILEAGLREAMQLHNEAVGKISNITLMGRPGMEVAPFAHAGIEGFMEMAWNAGLYGLFVFDTSTSKNQQPLPEGIPVNPKHAGLTPDQIKMAFDWPNWAKFNYVGGPNILITMNGTTPENLSTLSSFYANLIWPMLIMKGCNPTSNPQVSRVRKTTGALLERIAENAGRDPLEVIMEEMPKVIS